MHHWVIWKQPASSCAFTKSSMFFAFFYVISDIYAKIIAACVFIAKKVSIVHDNRRICSTLPLVRTYWKDPLFWDIVQKCGRWDVIDRSTFWHHISRVDVVNENPPARLSVRVRFFSDLISLSVLSQGTRKYDGAHYLSGSTCTFETLMFRLRHRRNAFGTIMPRTNPSCEESI